MSSLRVFCSIELPSPVRAAIADHIDHLRRGTAGDVRVSWERTEKLHITLKFIGEIATNRVATISEAAVQACTSMRPFLVDVKGVGTFPPRGLPRLLWIGIEETTGKLAELYHNLESACEALGFKRDERPFHPHLTIARIRSPHGARELAEAHEELGFRPQQFPVSELSVMRSELARTGSRYSEISRHPLVG